MARNERSAGFVLFRIGSDGRREYLLLDYGRHWDFAKGHLEKGEDDLTAARRELREETGISEIEIVHDFRHEIAYFFRDRKKGLIRKTVVFFLGQTTVTDQMIVLSNEHEGFTFVPFEAAIRQTTYANARQVLRLAEEKLAGTGPVPEGDSLSPDRVTG
jgi:8-oxo-dGTP pyrophosphatase MutT (NUDIX family)